MLTPLPKERTPKGGTWTSRSAETRLAAGQLTVESAYTRDGLVNRGGRQVEKISIKATGAFDPKTASAGEKGTFEPSEGTAYIDNVRGRLLEQSDTQNWQTESKRGDNTLITNAKITIAIKLVESDREKP